MGSKFIFVAIGKKTLYGSKLPIFITFYVKVMFPEYIW